jgi:glycosyltransferase involved in cell wall biosynthesis
MNLGFLYYYANLGGVTSVVKSRTPVLAKAGWNVHAFFAKDLGGVSDLRQAGVATVQIVPSIATNPTSVLANCNLDLLTVVDMPEVIRPLRDHFSGPLVFEVHTPIEKVLQKVVAADLDNVDRLLVPSLWSQRWVGERIRGTWDRGKVAVVPNIIDREVFRPARTFARPLRPLILWVGKIAAYKRWRDAVRILGKVRREVECDVAFATGSEVDEQGTQEFLTEMAACDMLGRCSWYHNLPTNEMANLYRDCGATGGLVLSTSEAESFCLVAHEAMSCGVPVVAARAGALPEAYPGVLRQLLFDVGDVDHAARIAVELLRDASLWLQMRADGLREQESYDSETLKKVYLTELQKAMRRLRAPSV